jgi:nucleoside-diphosphate-sugar epimerase
MKVLITGSGGQVGLELIRALGRAGHEVVATDVKPRPDGVAPAVPWLELDVTDLDAIESMLREHAPDVVYHLAAILSAVGEKIPHKCYEVNQTGTWNLLEAARRAGTGQVMFASTIAAFGPGLRDPVPNEVSMRPTTMYGVTKVAGELLGEYFHAKWGLDFRGVRFPGLINAGLPGGGTSDYALFMYVDGVRKGHYESFCHEETRIPLMYMPDAISALLDLSAAPRASLKRCIYNIQGFSPTAAAIADSVRRAMPGVELTFKIDPARQGILDSWPNALDDAKARAEWGFAPAYDLEQMTAHLIPEVKRMLDEGLIPPA